ncbi:MAG: hypothetical protein K6A69_04575 [Lachnospiraceae bacterium]|nr:hypothetical protein [Lachnospiraceae bacterium]
MKKKNSVVKIIVPLVVVLLLLTSSVFTLLDTLSGSGHKLGVMSSSVESGAYMTGTEDEASETEADAEEPESESDPADTEEGTGAGAGDANTSGTETGTQDQGEAGTGSETSGQSEASGTGTETAGQTDAGAGTETGTGSETTEQSTPASGTEGSVTETIQDIISGDAGTGTAVVPGAPAGTDANEMANAAAENTLRDLLINNQTDVEEESSAETKTEAETDTDSDSKDDKDKEKKENAEEDKESAAAFSQSVSASAGSDTMRITVEAPAGVFPEGSTVTARVVSSSEERAIERRIDGIRDDGANVAASYTYDITIKDKNGNEIEPDTSKGTVKVSFALSEVSDQNLDANVYHTSGDAAGGASGLSVEKLDASASANTLVTETTGFSYYTVEFTYNNLEYSMNGDSSVPLSTILSAVGLSGTVDAVTVSNPSLFSASRENGVWTVTAHQAFTSEESMTVTIGGTDYEIRVTDDPAPSLTVAITGWEYGSTANNPTCTLGEGVTGTPEYTYYTDSTGNTQTTTANGASANGGQPTKAGTYYVKAVIDVEDPGADIVSNLASFTISQVNLSDCTVALTIGSSPGDVVYNGNPQGVQTVTVKKGNFTLPEADYTVAKTPATATYEGTYTVSVSATGTNTTGTKSATWSIVSTPQRKITATNKTITFSTTTYDAASMFTVGSQLTGVTYTVTAGGTGEATISGSVLTITKCGTINVKCTANTTTGEATAAAKVREATATLTVNKAAGVATIAVPDVVYGRTPSPTTTSTTNGASLQGVTYRLSGSNTNVATPNAVGTYVATVTYSATNFYTEATAQTTFRVTKAPLTVKADDKSKAFGTADPVFTYTVTGLVNGDTKESALTGSLVRTAGETANTYRIIQGSLTAANYEITFTPGTFIITAIGSTTNSSTNNNNSGTSTGRTTGKTSGSSSGSRSGSTSGRTSGKTTGSSSASSGSSSNGSSGSGSGGAAGGTSGGTTGNGSGGTSGNGSGSAAGGTSTGSSVTSPTEIGAGLGDIDSALLGSEAGTGTALAESGVNADLYSSTGTDGETESVTSGTVKDGTAAGKRQEKPKDVPVALMGVGISAAIVITLTVILESTFAGMTGAAGAAGAAGTAGAAKGAAAGAAAETATKKSIFSAFKKGKKAKVKTKNKA